MDPLAQVIAYHERTKHGFHRAARSPGHLDWATQPEPFRRFDGCRRWPLPMGPDDGPPAYDALFQPGLIAPATLDAQAIGTFFYLSMAISAWKEYRGSRWALRCNPSSGNLHPTEAYALIPPASGFEDSAALYHYAPDAHALEVRARIASSTWELLPAALPDAGKLLVVGLTSIHWREAWKYGERAYRYCQHDVGHAVGALRLAAAYLGWGAVVLDRPSDDDVAALLGTDRAGDFHDDEPEVADLLMVVGPAGDALSDSAGGTDSASGGAPVIDLPSAFIEGVRDADWIGKANRLSPSVIRWDAIDIVHRCCHKPRTDELPQRRAAGFSLRDSAGSGAAADRAPRCSEPRASARADATASSPFQPADEDSAPLHAPSDATSLEPPTATAQRTAASATATSAAAIIRTRRSAVAYDGRTRLPHDAFCQILHRTLPGPPPFDALGAPTLIDLLLFVHRVDDVPPGLYCLVRDQARLETLQHALDARRSSEFLGITELDHGRPDTFEWIRPDGCPAALPLYRLRTAGCTALASQVSCTQDIAGDGCFSLGMLATYHASLKTYGPWIYRRLFWETGLIGQVLYLEAEAAGIRATGIGCYFDDPMHQTFGLEGIEFQSLYHFTMGGAVEDTRLTTLPAYGQRRL